MKDTLTEKEIYFNAAIRICSCYIQSVGSKKANTFLFRLARFIDETEKPTLHGVLLLMQRFKDEAKEWK